jgi:hypothetical protein
VNNPELLKLPYDTWNGLFQSGIPKVEILETIEDQKEYRLRVPFNDRYHELHLKHDGKQMRVIEFSDRFPKRVIKTLDWRFSIEATKKAVMKLVEADKLADPDNFDFQTSYNKAINIVFEK